MRLQISMVCILALSGCASLNSQFDCPIKPGVMCKSLDDVNDMVNQGKLGGPRDNLPSLDCLTDCSSNSMNQSTRLVSGLNDPAQNQRIWIAPYEDNQGDCYGAQLIYHRLTPDDLTENTSDPLKNRRVY